MVVNDNRESDIMLTNTVKAIAAAAGVNRAALAAALNLSSAQAVTNKYTRDSFTGQDLVKVAAACGVRLAFVDDSGRAVLMFPPPPADGE